MTLKKFVLKSGVNRENTRYTTEGGWYSSDKVRFRQGTPEKIGGWERISANTFVGLCRSLWAWATNYSQKVIGVMTDTTAYVSYNGSYMPINFNIVAPASFTVASTNGSAIVRITVGATLTPNTSEWIGSGIQLFNCAAIGGNVTAASLNKVHTIVNVDTTSWLWVEINLGFTADTSGSTSGYGAYSEPAYSNLFSQSNFGQDLVFNRRGGQLAIWSGGGAFLIPNQTFTTNYTASNTTLITAETVPAYFNELAGLNRLKVQFWSTGTLPAGLTAFTDYYLYSGSGSSPTNTLTIYTGATGSSTVTLTGNGTGTHYIRVVAQTVYDVIGDAGNSTLDAPSAVNVSLVSDIYRFAFAMGVNDYGNAGTYSAALDPMLIRWCDQEDISQWSPTATNQAGSLRLSRGSEIITAIQARQEVLVWTDAALYSLQYQGPPTVWGAQLVGDNISIVSQNAVAYAAGVAFWMGKDKFYLYNGNVATLNCDLRQYVFSDINTSQYSQIFAGTNEGFNEVWWFYCSANSSTVDRYVIFNYVENIWYYGTMERTAWLDAGILDYPLAATYINNLVYHEKGVDDNSTGTPAAITASITSAEFDVEDGDQFMFIRRVLPDLTFRNSTAGSPSGVLTFYPLKNSGSGYTDPASVGGDSNATVTRTATVPIEAFTGQVYVRLRARQLAMKFESTGVGVSWQLGAVRLDIKPDGKASGSGVSGG